MIINTLKKTKKNILIEHKTFSDILFLSNCWLMTVKLILYLKYQAHFHSFIENVFVEYYD